MAKKHRKKTKREKIMSENPQTFDKKTGAGGEEQIYDKRDGEYAKGYDDLSTEELRERQMIELPGGSHPPVEEAYCFNRLDTKHHIRHARELGFKSTHEYEQAAVEFFNSDRGKLYYSLAKQRFYRYEERTKLFCSSSHGEIHTFLKYSNKKFEDIKKQDKAYEYYS